MKALRGWRNVIAWTLIAGLLAALAGWLLFTAACLYSSGAPLCQHPHGGGIVSLLAIVAVIGPLALTARERARRQMGRGMYARPTSERAGTRWGGTVEQVVRFALVGEWGGGQQPAQTHPLDLPATYGWIVSLSDGTAVRVYVTEFYQLISDAWQYQQNPANARRAATGQRRLDPLIGRPKTLAVNELLRVAGGVRQNKVAANSLRRIEGTPWGILERLVEIWPPGEV